MAGRVIQGFFVGGRMRVPGPAAHGGSPVQRSAMPGPPVPVGRGGAAVQRHGGTGGSAGGFAIDPTQVGLARGGGSPLPPAVLAKMEGAFGADFSAVRVHVGPQASRIGALAFATGNELYFAPGQYDPGSVRGQQLIGHELAHVVQQRQGRVRAPGSGVSVVQDHALEAEADRLGARAAMFRPPVQAKMAGGVGTGGGRQVHLSSPRSLGANRYRVSAGVGGREVGSAVLHLEGATALHVTDLGVDSAHREQGIGRMLLSQAAKAGQRLGRGIVTLASEDKGSGKLTNWYRSMGFQQRGVNERGLAELAAPVARLIGAGGPVQPMMREPSPAAGRLHHRPPGPIQRAAAPAPAPAKPQAAPTYLYHGAPKEVFESIRQTGLEARSGKEGGKYVCMSERAGATPLLKGNRPSDAIFRVKVSDLPVGWTRAGAGETEWRGPPIPADKLQWRRRDGKEWAALG